MLSYGVIFLLGFAMCIFGPWRADIAPETRSLVARLHQATLDRASAQQGLAAYHARLQAQAVRIEALNASQRVQMATQRGLARENQALAARLAQHPESTVTLAVELGRGIALQGQACEGAVSACEKVQGELRQRITTDSLRTDSIARRAETNFGLAHDATGSAVRWEVSAHRYQRQRTMALILSGILAIVAAVK